MYVCQRAYFIDVLTLDPRPFRILALALCALNYLPLILKKHTYYIYNKYTRKPNYYLHMLMSYRFQNQIVLNIELNN